MGRIFIAASVPRVPERLPRSPVRLLFVAEKCRQILFNKFGVNPTADKIRVFDDRVKKREIGRNSLDRD